MFPKLLFVSVFKLDLSPSNIAVETPKYLFLICFDSCNSHDFLIFSINELIFPLFFFFIYKKSSEETKQIAFIPLDFQNKVELNSPGLFLLFISLIRDLMSKRSPGYIFELGVFT